MFDADKSFLTLAQLRKVPVTQPPRGAGKIWQGVQHGTLLDAVLAHGKHENGAVFKTDEIRIWTTDDGGDMAVSVPVGGGTKFESRGLVPHLALVASNRQTEILTAFCGAVGADGLMFVNSRLSRNKDAKWMYTTHFDLDYVKAAIWTWWLRMLPAVLDDFDQLARTPANPARVNHVLMAVGRKELLPWSRVGAADRAFRVRRGATLLDLYGAISLPLGMSSAIHQLKAGWRLNSLLCHVARKKGKEAV